MTTLDTKALLEGVTPGDWEVPVDPTGKGRTFVTAAVEGGRIVICQCGFGSPEKTVRAQARLIASAPRLARRVIELEEALLPFAELAGGDVNMNDPLRKWVTVGQLWDARAALKGEGDE